MGSTYTSCDYNMTITKVKIKSTFDLFFLEAAVQSRTVPFTSHSTCRTLKEKRFDLFQQNLTPLTYSTFKITEGRAQVEYIIKL